MRRAYPGSPAFLIVRPDKVQLQFPDPARDQEWLPPIDRDNLMEVIRASPPSGVILLIETLDQTLDCTPFPRSLGLWDALRWGWHRVQTFRQRHLLWKTSHLGSLSWGAIVLRIKGQRRPGWGLFLLGIPSAGGAGRSDDGRGLLSLPELTHVGSLTLAYVSFAWQKLGVGREGLHLLIWDSGTFVRYGVVQGTQLLAARILLRPKTREELAQQGLETLRYACKVQGLASSGAVVHVWGVDPLGAETLVALLEAHTTRVDVAGEDTFGAWLRRDSPRYLKDILLSGTDVPGSVSPWARKGIRSLVGGIGLGLLIGLGWYVNQQMRAETHILQALEQEQLQLKAQTKGFALTAGVCRQQWHALGQAPSRLLRRLKKGLDLGGAYPRAHLRKVSFSLDAQGRSSLTFEVWPPDQLAPDLVPLVKTSAFCVALQRILQPHFPGTNLQLMKGDQTRPLYRYGYQGEALPPRISRSPCVLKVVP